MNNLIYNEDTISEGICHSILVGIFRTEDRYNVQIFSYDSPHFNFLIYFKMSENCNFTFS